MGESELQIEHLPELKYTEMVIKETLRLYPIAPMMVRQTTGDIDLGKNKCLKQCIEVHCTNVISLTIGKI